MQMKTRAAGVLAASAAAFALVGTPAFAAVNYQTPVTSGIGSVLGGNQATLGLNVPVSICGIAANILSVNGLGGAGALAGCQGDASVLDGI